MNNNSINPKTFFLVILIFLVMMYVKSNQYNEEYISSMANEMNMGCLYEIENFYEDKGYLLVWVGRAVDSNKEYAQGEKRWSLPFISSKRYDLFDRDTCRFVAKVRENAIPEDVFYTSAYINEILRDDYN